MGNLQSIKPLTRLKDAGDKNNRNYSVVPEKPHWEGSIKNS